MQKGAACGGGLNLLGLTAQVRRAARAAMAARPPGAFVPGGGAGMHKTQYYCAPGYAGAGPCGGRPLAQNKGVLCTRPKLMSIEQKFYLCIQQARSHWIQDVVPGLAPRHKVLTCGPGRAGSGLWPSKVPP